MSGRSGWSKKAWLMRKMMEHSLSIAVLLPLDGLRLQTSSTTAGPSGSRTVITYGRPHRGVAGVSTYHGRLEGVAEGDRGRQ
jgi:hypothetical protein